MSRALGDLRVGIKFRGMGILLSSLVICSCSVQPTRPASVTPLDIKSRNVEKIRAGLESVVGGDSAGAAALDDVSWYESQLAEHFPTEKVIINRKLEEPQDDERELVQRYTPWHAPQLEFPPLLFPQERTQLQLFRSFRDQMLKNSVMRMSKGYESFMASGNLGDAKMAFAAGYVTLTLTPPTAELEQIDGNMTAILDSMSARKQIK